MEAARRARSRLHTRTPAHWRRTQPKLPASVRVKLGQGWEAAIAGRPPRSVAGAPATPPSSPLFCTLFSPRLGCGRPSPAGPAPPQPGIARHRRGSAVRSVTHATGTPCQPRCFADCPVNRPLPAASPGPHTLPRSLLARMSARTHPTRDLGPPAPHPAGHWFYRSGQDSHHSVCQPDPKT
jgi:hypothetical protein